MAKKTATPIAELRASYGRPITQYYDTGIFLLNDLWGGGLPSGKMVEIHSGEGLGKTTLTIQMLVFIIKKYGKKVAFMDVEGALDEDLRNKLGMTQYENDDEITPSFLYICPHTYDEVSKTLNILINGKYDIIVYDSIANTSLDIDEEEEGDFKISKKIGQHSLMQGELLKMFKGRLARTGKTLVVINQMRANIKTNPMAKGPELTTAGGKVLDHNMDIRTAITRKEWIFDNEIKIGARIKLTTIKNKCTYPYRQIELELVFGRGINKVATMYGVLEARGILKRAGAYYSLPWTDAKMLGAAKVIEYIRENYLLCVSKLEGNSTVQVNVEDAISLGITKEGIEKLVPGFESTENREEVIEKFDTEK